MNFCELKKAFKSIKKYIKINIYIIITNSYKLDFFGKLCLQKGGTTFIDFAGRRN